MLGDGEAGHRSRRPGPELVDQERPSQAADDAKSGERSRSAAIVPLVGGASAFSPTTSG
jgi:hypothetical protein